MEDLKSCSCGRLSVCALGGAVGILSALAILILGVLAHVYHYATDWVTVASSVYVGFAATPKGILIGVIWGFVEGFVFGALLAWLYNVIAKRCPCKYCKKVREGI